MVMYSFHKGSCALQEAIICFPPGQHHTWPAKNLASASASAALITLIFFASAFWNAASLCTCIVNTPRSTYIISVLEDSRCQNSQQFQTYLKFGCIRMRHHSIPMSVISETLIENAPYVGLLPTNSVEVAQEAELSLVFQYVNFTPWDFGHFFDCDFAQDKVKNVRSCCTQITLDI